MKFCTHCGAELAEDAEICLKCGCPTSVKTQEAEVVKSNLNPLALVGFILSLVSGFLSLVLLLVTANSSSGIFVLAIPFTIAGLVCSIIGLVKTKRNKQRGKGFAIAGLVVSAVVCALWIFIFLISMYLIVLVYIILILIFAI